MLRAAQGRNIDPKSVHLSGTLIAGGGGPGLMLKFSGTLTDVATGRSVDFETTELGEGAGIGAGIYTVSGTLKGGFNVLSKPFSIGFTYAGLGPVSLGAASIYGSSGQLGQIDISGIVQTPAGAYLLGFPAVRVVHKAIK